MARVWYRVRVRECLRPDKVLSAGFSPGKWVKKSKFYFARNPGDAAKKYKGSGSIISVEKVQGERVNRVGEFFGLGDQILKELKSPVTGKNNIVDQFFRKGGEDR